MRRPLDSRHRQPPSYGSSDRLFTSTLHTLRSGHSATLGGGGGPLGHSRPSRALSGWSESGRSSRPFLSPRFRLPPRRGRPRRPRERLAYPSLTTTTGQDALATTPRVLPRDVPFPVRGLRRRRRLVSGAALSERRSRCFRGRPSCELHKGLAPTATNRPPVCRGAEAGGASRQAVTKAETAQFLRQGG